MNMLRIARALREENAMRVPTGPEVRQFEEQYQEVRRRIALAPAGIKGKSAEGPEE